MWSPPTHWWATSAKQITSHSFAGDRISDCRPAGGSRRGGGWEWGMEVEGRCVERAWRRRDDNKVSTTAPPLPTDVMQPDVWSVMHVLHCSEGDSSLWSNTQVNPEKYRSKPGAMKRWRKLTTSIKACFFAPHRMSNWGAVVVVAWISLTVPLSVEPAMRTDSRPGKSRRSPLQTLYKGDQVKTEINVFVYLR